MTDKVQAIGQLRFALERLSERNAQHDWEHVCRHIARARICRNILPATGPVQSGGDQGRDFETFRTYLSRSPIANRSFVGVVASDKPLAFACTVEKKIEPKIRNDVTTIMSSGTRVEGIYVFCTEGVPVAKRHKLQTWAREQYSVSLDILDGAAISELLAERELFWIAEHYLELPTSILPDQAEAAEEQGWYNHVLSRWRQETRPPHTFADFAEIRAAARDALGPFAYDEHGRNIPNSDRPELPFWIERLDQLAAEDTIPGLRRRALYEASVLRLRGLGSLMGEEHRLQAYFADVPTLERAADLVDAQVLLIYVFGASMHGMVNLEDAELRAWFAAVEQRIDERIREATRRGWFNERCILLESRAHIALFHGLQVGEENVNAAFAYWRELVELAARAPLFPLEDFADRMTDFARRIQVGSYPDYMPLMDQVDALLAQRFGQFKVAEKCVDRAMALRDAGDLPSAMAQLHRAKIDWFAEETLGRSLAAIAWLSSAYEEQGLLFAAKYYALTGAFIVVHSDDLRLKPRIAPFLEYAADYDYSLGAWHGFLELAETSAIFYPHYTRDLGAEFDREGSALQRLAYHLSMARILMSLLHPTLAQFAMKRTMAIAARVGLDVIVEELVADTSDGWAARGISRVWEDLERQLAGPPWSDAGPTRSVEWRGLGVTWRAQWDNDYETTLVAEGFLASLQIVLSDLIGHDLCLLRSTLEIVLHVVPLGVVILGEESGYKGFDLVFEASHDVQRARVTLPPYRSYQDGTLSDDDLHIGAVTVACMLVSRMSLLPVERFNKILGTRYAQGLTSKLLVGAPYAKCLREFVDVEVFVASQRSAHPPLVPPAPFVPRQAVALPWFGGPGPGYSPDEVCQHITNRYREFARRVPRTLARLVQEPEFFATVERLRASGWKDWHILMAVFHVTVNYRINHRPPIWMSPDAEEAYAQRLAREPEPENALLVPLHEYSEEALRGQAAGHMLAFLQTYGLEIHQHTPDMAAVEDFLDQRYGFWTDDVEHDDPFKRETAEPAGNQAQ